MRTRKAAPKAWTIVAVAPLIWSMASCTRSNPERGAATTAPARGLAQAVTVTGTVVNLTAQPMSLGLRDGSTAPMWGYCVNTSCGTTWSPGPTIVAKTGDPLTINLTNKLNVPTSLVILGQVGGGVGTPVKMDGPVHSGQTATTFPGNGATSPAFTPPAQGQRVRSFGAEVGAGATRALTWNKLKPGTYLYETGTMPSLEVPMGLYGVLIVTDAPTATAPGSALSGRALRRRYGAAVQRGRRRAERAPSTRPRPPAPTSTSASMIRRARTPRRATRRRSTTRRRTS